MQEEDILRKFQKLKSLLVATNIPTNLLLEIIENYLMSTDDSAPAAEPIPVINGKMSLFDAV